MDTTIKSNNISLIRHWGLDMESAISGPYFHARGVDRLNINRAFLLDACHGNHNIVLYICYRITTGRVRPQYRAIGFYDHVL